MKVKSQESRVKSRMIRCLAVSFALALLPVGRALPQCAIDPITGQQICAIPPNSQSSITAPALDSRLSALDYSAHCRISVADGSTGSGTLIAVDESLGLVLTCSHLFDQSTGRIVVTFPNGSRFGARLIERDRAHDLAALSIRRPAIEPLMVSDEQPASELTACGFGPNGQFRCIRGVVTGQATAVGATHPSLTLSGAVRPGDSGGGVLNPRGQLVGVVWGQRDGLTYTTCGRPLREFLDRVRGQHAATSPQEAWPAWSSKIESQIRALDEKKQDKGQYLKPEDLRGYLRIADTPKLDADQFAQRSEVDGSITALTARIQAIQQHVQQVAASEGGFFQGLSFGKLIVGALGLSGPLAAAVLIAGGLAGRRAKKRFSVDRQVESTGGRPSAADGAHAPARSPQPIAVDTPPPPQRTVPETHYVSVEKDTFAKAHQWASEHVVRKYPGASDILQAQDSLIKQYLAAH